MDLSGQTSCQPLPCRATGHETEGTGLLRLTLGNRSIQVWEHSCFHTCTTHTHNTNIKSTMLYHASNMLRARTQHHSLTLPYDSSNSRPSKVGCLLSYRCSTAVNSGLRCRECWRWRHHHEGIRRGTSHHHSALAGHFFSSPMEPVGPVDTLKPGPNWLMISNLFVHTVYDMICILHMWDVHSTLI